MSENKTQATKAAPKVTKKTIRKGAKGGVAPTRLWTKAIFVGFRRSKANQNSNQALLKIQHVQDANASQFYWGKRCAYIYKAHATKNNTKYRSIWGRISRAHGDNGVVVARFKNNLPPRAMGATIRVFLYPHRFQANKTAAAKA